MMGRPKGYPGEIHPFTLGKNYRYPKSSSEKRIRPGGKIEITLFIPAELYDQILSEAKEHKLSFARQALEYLTAGASPE